MVNLKISEMPKISKSDVKDLQNVKSLEVGFFDSAKYPSGESVASVAFWNDMGTHNIPPRPFFRNALEKNKNAWGGLLQNALSENQNARQSFGILGEKARGDIIQSIMQTNTPPLSKSTIRQKGSSKPLIDTGLMRRSVSYEIK